MSSRPKNSALREFDNIPTLDILLRRTAVRRLLVLGLIFLMGLAAVAAQITSGPRSAQWKQVEEAMKKGLPKSAIEKLDPIIESAKKDKAWAEAIRAVGLKIGLEGNIQGNKPEEKITRMREAIESSPAEMKPVMQAILAHWYWHYFQQNRWRIAQRTQTASIPGDDVTAWSLPQILDEVDRQFQQALSHAEELKKTPVADYDALLVKGTMPDSYRPTLYDFLAHEALAFYTSGESTLVQPQDAFVLESASPIFGTVEQFLNWDLKEHRDSQIAKAIMLYQELLKFHTDDKETSALLATDLSRLVFGHNHAVGEEKNALYVAALRRFAAAHRDHDLASMAYFHWADVLRVQNKLVEAREIALQGKNLHPESVGGKQCHNTVVQIEAKSVQLITERVWNKPLPVIDVNYRNITRLHFRVVAASWEERLQQRRRRPEWLDDNDRKELLAKTPVKTWMANLPATEDYQQRIESLAAPEDLKPGYYYLIASHNESFGGQDNVVQYTDFWISDLALVTRHENGVASLGGLVTNANSGQPIKGAQIQSWIYQNRTNNWSKGPTATTDDNGLFKIDGDAKQQHHLTIQVKHGNDQLVSANDYYLYSYDRTVRADERTIFFTDRALYRPGQTIQYKGLSIRVDQNANQYQVLKRRTLTVVFNDPNGKEIARQQHQSNDFGSFNGSFTAPTDRVLGSMSLQVDGQPAGAAQIRVEEYKRPKFQVEFDPAQEAPRLGEDVTVTGKATAYTGAPIDGAQVRWRVVRQVRFPDWWFWWRGWRTPHRDSQEIAHGTATTDREGKFTVTFTAEPDRSVAEESEPVFTFAVSADVTDNAGETRSAEKTVSAGYTALQASLSAADWQTAQKPIEITVQTKSLDGEPRAASGKIRIHQLQQPGEVHRRPLHGRFARPSMPADGKEETLDLSNPANWTLGEVVAEKTFATGENGSTEISFDLKAGAYQAVAETQDRFGKPVTARLQIQVLDPDAKKLAIKIPFLFTSPKATFEPGDEFVALWGSGYDTARAYVEIEHRQSVVKAFWTDPSATQVKITHPVTEELRGGFTVRVTMIRENRAYTISRHVDVPWRNKRLAIKWERFVSKLMPGAKESFTAIITGPDADAAVAEMVATLYDASLDAYLPHRFLQSLGVFYQNRSNLNSRFENQEKYFNHLFGNFRVDYKTVEMRYRAFPAEIIANLFGYQWFHGQELRKGGMPPAPATAATGMDADRLELANANPAEAQAADKRGAADGRQLQQGGQGGGAAPDLSQVSARQNLAETAFFFPHLVSNSQGEVRMEFTMPEALTEWKFMGFAHDAELRSGYLEGSTVTSKDLMIQPNPPRFVREGDVLEFTVKVTNRSPRAQEGSVRLSFSDARTNESVDSKLGLDSIDQPFEVPAGESRSYSWKLQVPDGLGFLVYKAVGASGKLSDGEEGFLPVLPRRILITESLPLPIRGETTRSFEFKHLLASGASDSLEHQSLTVQMASNPSWYAVLALPYLMEFPHQCSEQVFNRLYANSLGRHIVQSDPKIRRVFELWRNTPALDSPLLKNQDLKSVLVEETPWLRQAQDESQARRNVAVLFDENRLNAELARAAQQLAELQYDDGAWPWFPGGPANDFITLYIVTGYGRLRHLGAQVDVAPAVKALARLDNWIEKTYRQILKGKSPEKNHLNSTVALYLYARSFFLQDRPIDDAHQEAVGYFRDQARKYWLQLAVRQSQGHLSLALHRFGDKEAAQAILNSLRERSVTNDELGMFWRDLELSWWWYRAPIETQALMIEVFEEVGNDDQAVEECKVWLLKQKQTQDWKTTKATADAVYALLLRGGLDVLASDSLVAVQLGNTQVKPENVEAGTGFFQQRFVRTEIKPDMGNITVKKSDPGVAWGGVHWQYFEDVANVPIHEGTPLKISKSLFTKIHSEKGPVLKPVEGELAVGNELVVRVEIRVDRDMEYVHLKDQRGSGTEPVDVLSQYQYRDGLAYYQSTRDTASHFFIDYLPKGTYVFEYSTWVVHRGRYQSGIASIESMYAPEFNSHSNSVELKVK